jgi:hypothetical protein
MNPLNLPPRQLPISVSKLEKSPLPKDIAQNGPIIMYPQTGSERFAFNAKLER